MLKIKNNKFIIFIISIIILIIGFGLINSFYNTKINRESYIVLITGNGTLNGYPLKTNMKEVVSVGDTVRIIGNSALAILEWGDGSVTRLGGDSSIKIDNLYLSLNLDKINISFELLSGKTWSTVISFLGEDSYFKESFRDSVAAVRGTVFDVDLDNEYLYVVNHKVNLIKGDGEEVIINQNNPLNLETFDFISLEDFLKSFKDKAWQKLNNSIDKDLFKGLEDEIYKNLDQIVNIENLDIDKILNDEKKKELYNKILKDYQKLNFVESDDELLFKKKIELKEALIKLSSGKNKKILLENTFYDFNDIIDSKNYDKIDILLPIIGDNKDLINSLDFSKVINFNNLPKTIKNKLLDLEIYIYNKFNDINNFKNKAGIIKNNLINK